MNLADNLRKYFATHGASFAQQINRGIEKEALRIGQSGHLSPSAHPSGLGSALTHPYITTDYAESLLEFITPVEQSISTSLRQLSDLHKFAYSQQTPDLLWPMSMPCFVGDESDIIIAQYGRSNVGRMKTLYREGLKNRYGSNMQVISGVHFNFSFPDVFFEQLAQSRSQQVDQAFVSDTYLALLRNVKRYLWLLCYLFGASPALCSSFLGQKKTHYDFKKVGKGTLYLPYATSLRLSDLGYTNNSQAALDIRYNELGEYIAGLKKAIQLPAKEFAHIASGEEGIYHQLNANILQIENEYYSPVRPKRVTQSGEKPTEALARGGVQYIEIRALDVNPFSPCGIDENQIRFMDVFLTWCALKDSAPLESGEEQINNKNLQATILEGRKPGLTLEGPNGTTTLTQWAESMLQSMLALAKDFDQDSGSVYQDAISAQLDKVKEANLTPSGQIIAQLVTENIDNGTLGMKLAKDYQKLAQTSQFSYFSEQELTQVSEQSVVEQARIEAADTVSFEAYLAEYFK